MVEKFDDNILQLREKDCIKRLAASFARNKFKLEAKKQEIRAVVYNFLLGYKMEIGHVDQTQEEKDKAKKRKENLKRLKTIKEKSPNKKVKKKKKKKKTRKKNLKNKKN